MFTEPFDGFDICPTILPRKSKNKQRLCTIVYNQFNATKRREIKKLFFFKSPTTLPFNNMLLFLSTTTMYNMLREKRHP